MEHFCFDNGADWHAVLGMHDWFDLVLLAVQS